MRGRFHIVFLIAFLTSISCGAEPVALDPQTEELVSKYKSAFVRWMMIREFAQKPDSAARMLDAMAANRIPRRALSPKDAQTILDFKSPTLDEKLSASWGTMRETPPETLKLIEQWSARLTPDALVKADKSLGRFAFSQTCSACHTLYGEGGKIGPDLTPLDRADIPSLIRNIVDPSAIVLADYRPWNLKTTDGRVYNGIIASQTAQTVTLLTLTEKVTVERSQIAKLSEAPHSVMPDGLLETLPPDQVVNLFAYLISSAQVPMPPASVTFALAGSTPQKRGEGIFVQKCAMCHQASALGSPPAYPPLAASDWIAADRARAIKVLCEGLNGKIKVNNVEYANQMPAQVLDDQQVADVLTYVGANFGNKLEPFNADEVKTARARSKYPTFEIMLKAVSYQPLPKPPEGWSVHEVVQLPEFCTRMATDAKGEIVYVLAQNGGVYMLDAKAAALTQIIRPEEYIDVKRGGVMAVGFTLDTQNRLWVVTNQKLNVEPIYQSEVVIWRSSDQIDGRPARLKPWFKTQYPYGVGPYNHGVSHIAFGPDGMLYISSGSRTDGGETGNDPHLSRVGETDITACLWRLDPRTENPQLEIFVRGLRNPYGFAWDDKGRLFSVTNGPDADAPEEMDFLEKGKHYGFPYQYSNWPAKEGSPYPHTPKAPEGLTFTMPVVNVGPAGGGTADKPMSTFDPHSSPAGMIWCGDEFPAPLRGGFLVTRYGNLLSIPEDKGYDVLSVKLEQQPDKSWLARTTTILAPLGRPLDVIRIPGGRALILEYTRPTDFKSQLGWLPGRIIELAPTK